MRLIVCRLIVSNAVRCIMDIKRRLGQNLKNWRELRGISQEGLADLCGLHRTYISGIERGVRNPTIVVLDRIASSLNVSPGDLLLETKSSKRHR